MQMNKYQVLAARTINKGLTAQQAILHALHGMSSEIGELHGIYQKFYQGHDFDSEHLKKELGDLLWFIAEYCTIRNWTLDEIAQMNIDKLIARYPDGFSQLNSMNRQKGDI